MNRNISFLAILTVASALSACSSDSPANSGSGGTAGATGGTAGSGGSGGAGSNATGGSGGASGTAGSTGQVDAGAVPAAAPPRLHVEGNAVKTDSGKTVVLRGSSLIDIGAVYAWGSTPDGPTNISNRIDALIATGLGGHIVRLPVYPRTNFNQMYPYYSPLPFPVGPTAPASANLNYKVKELSAEDYVSKVLKPAVDYASSLGMYVIIDYHQIDDTTGTSTSGTDANTFWTQVAPVFKDYTNVLYEAFNEPIDIGPGSPSDRWKAFKPMAQGWVDTIRSGAPDNLIIVGSPSWCQTLAPAATDPVNGKNLVYTAHIYPGNWDSFKNQFDAAAAAHPIAVTEWGYATKGDANLVAKTATWGTDLRTYLDSKGASWTAWVADDKWGPPLYQSIKDGTLSEFGALTKDWLSEKSGSDWVE